LPSLPNDWLAWDLKELEAFCQHMDIPTGEGLEVQVSLREPDKGLGWDRSFGFVLT